MTAFTITAFRPDGEKVQLVYDNSDSSLLWADSGNPVIDDVQATPLGVAFAVSKNNPGRKAKATTTKISLGLSCNYSCTYCSQRFVPDAAEAGLRDIPEFIARFPDWFDYRGTDKLGKGRRVEFWGGEPFVYWKTMKPLAEKLRILMPNATFSVITNGSLLTIEKNEWLERMGFFVAISHDGPGQKTRGPDPFDNVENLVAIIDLYSRLHPRKKISFNPVFHRENTSRAAVQEFFTSRFGDDVVIGEGDVIDPYDGGGLHMSFRQGEHEAFRWNAFQEIRAGKTDNFKLIQNRIGDFLQSIRTARPAASLGQKCGMERSDKIAVNMRGDVLTCQNTSSVATAPNGNSHKLGNVSKLEDVRLTTATHWSHRDECASCPVLHLCRGSCMFLEGERWTKACDNSFSDQIPFFAATIELLTGAIPVHIEGPIPENRKWIWGDAAR